MDEGRAIDVDRDVDVVIVGAGIAGLAAARAISKAGLRVSVLEARSRVGGRLLSVPAEGGLLDVGATWYWPNEPRVCALVAELEMATHPQYLEGDAIYHDSAGIHRLEGNPLDVASERTTGGTQELAHAVARHLPLDTLHLDHAVTRIESTPSGVVAHSAQGVFRARQLILAIPPALAAAAVDFSPALDHRVADIARNTPVWMGAMTKVVAQFATPFWRDHGLAGAAMSQVGPMREIHDMSGRDGRPAALFGFAPALSTGAETVSAAAVLAQLTEIFGPDASDPTALVIHDWRAEVYTSPPDVEALQRHELFGHPCYQTPALGGRLHWAATETSRAFPGHIEGALAAADRAASAVILAKPD